MEDWEKSATYLDESIQQLSDIEAKHELAIAHLTNAQILSARAEDPSGIDGTDRGDRTESDLRSYRRDPFIQGMKRAGMDRVYVGNSLEAVYADALKDTQGSNWWDVLLAVAIVVLVIEAAVANRSIRKDEDLIPAHLNARLTT